MAVVERVPRSEESRARTSAAVSAVYSASARLREAHRAEFEAFLREERVRRGLNPEARYRGSLAERAARLRERIAAAEAKLAELEAAGS